MGRQAQNLRGILSLNSPVRNGVIENWDDLETLWEHVWERESKVAAARGGGVNNGNANEEDYRVLVSVPPLCPPEDWRKMGEVMQTLLLLTFILPMPHDFFSSRFCWRALAWAASTWPTRAC